MDTKAHTPPTVPRTYNNLSDQSSNSALVSCSVSNFMADNVTSICPILPQSPPHGIAPRVDVARSRFGRLFLQLLPLVSNKHLISLSLHPNQRHFRDEAGALRFRCRGMFQREPNRVAKKHG